MGGQSIDGFLMITQQPHERRHIFFAVFCLFLLFVEVNSEECGLKNTINESWAVHMLGCLPVVIIGRRSNLIWNVVDMSHWHGDRERKHSVQTTFVPITIDIYNMSITTKISLIKHKISIILLISSDYQRFIATNRKIYKFFTWSMKLDLESKLKLNSFQIW